MALYEHVSLDIQMFPEPLVVAEKLDKAAAFLENMVPVMQATKQAVEKSMQRRFDTQTDPEGNAWAPWAKSYVEHAQFASSSLLVKSGALKSAATGDAVQLDGHTVFFNAGALPTSDDGTNYGLVHQEGRASAHANVFKEMRAQGLDIVDTPEVGMPARPFIGVDDEAGDEIFLIFDQWVDQAIDIGTFQSGPSAGRAFFRDPTSGRFTSLK